MNQVRVQKLMSVIKRKFVRTSFLIFFSFVILFASVFIVSFSESYYNFQVEKLGISVKDVYDVHSGVISFLKGQGDLPLVFNGREFAHMVDVRNVFSLFFVLEFFLILICFFLWFFITKKNLLLDISRYILYLVFFFSFLGFFFSNSFVIFHGFFFEGDSWLFPYDSILIKMYPEQFFFETFVLILVVSASVAAIFALIYLVTTTKFIKKFNPKK